MIWRASECGVAMVCVLVACARPAPAPSAAFHTRALSAEDSRMWRGYLESIDALLRGASERTRGLIVLEVRTRLAENLAAASKTRTELPRPIALRAGQLLTALDGLFERLSAEERAGSAPPPPRPSVAPRDAEESATFALEAPELPRRVVRRAGPGRERGGLLAAAPLSSQGAPLAARDTDADISEGEVDDGGPAVDLALPVPPPKSVLRWPLATARLTSRFGHRRDPMHGRLSFHDGVDLSAPRGARVLASARGRVTFAGRRGGGGNVVVVEHLPGLKTVYAHLDHIAVERGARLRSGDVVGLVGSTGRATGPHLHFVVRLRGRSVDPMSMVGRTRDELLANAL